MINQQPDERFIDLSLPKVQSLLCKTLKRVNTLDDAKKWRSTFGYLWTENAEQTLQLAKTLAWIYNFHDLLAFSQVPLLRKFLALESSIDRATAQITEDEFYDLSSRFMAGEKLETDDSMRVFQVILNADHPKRGYAKFTPDANFETHVHYMSVGFGSQHAMVFEANDPYLEQRYEDMDVLQTDDDVLLEAASNYFLILIQQQLECMQLSIKCVNGVNGRQFHQTFDARYPWQAILACLVRDITRMATPKKCRNEGCPEIFIPKRADQLFCSRPGCRKAVSRKRQLNEQNAETLQLGG